MPDYAQARKNMIDCQLKPNDVYDQKVLDAFQAVPRENFLPSNSSSFAYIDEDVVVTDGRYLMEPFVFARLVQAADIQENDYVLSVGTGMGYGCAVASFLAETIIGIDVDKALVKQGGKALEGGEYANAALFHSEHIDGYKKEAPYDVIFIEGSVADAPTALFDQLKDGGRLLTILRPDARNAGGAVKYTNNAGNIIKETLFDANTPYLEGFEPKSGFSF